MMNGGRNISLKFLSVNVNKIMKKEMLKEITKELLPKNMTKEDWKIFIKECKEKLEQTKCFLCDDLNKKNTPYFGILNF